MALLALSDESVFYGYSKGYGGAADGTESVHSTGEVVFNTAMSGYQEVITDPSYHSQIVNFTMPHIGNTGANAQDEEAQEIFAAGVVARAISPHCTHWRAAETLPHYLARRGVLAIDGVDTRAITRRLRESGALGGCLMVPALGTEAQAAAQEACAHARAFAGLSGAMLAADASAAQAADWREGEWQAQGNAFAAADAAAPRRVTVLDCGVKKNILRALTQRGCSVHVLPYAAAYRSVQESAPHGVLISNGPGDPAPCENARALAQQLLADGVPLFGLCLGHQVVAAALGAKTEKMKFGHHGANHPVRAEADGRVLITSQNHGFAVRTDTLPPHVRVTHRSLFDGSLQGIVSDAPPLMTFQGHPEASPGPKDAGVLFDQFVAMMDAHRHA